MKLDVECVRDVMLELEGFPMGTYQVNSLQKSIQEHGLDTVHYTVVKLIEADFINAGYARTMDGNMHIGCLVDLTFKGHQFLETIREHRVWTKTKGIIGKIGSSGFGIVTHIANSYLSDLADAYLKSKLPF